MRPRASSPLLVDSVARQRRLFPLVIGTVLLLSGCAGRLAVPAANPPPQATAILVYDELRSAFLLADRETRRREVRSLTRSFLADIQSRGVGDEAASALLTDIAQTSHPLLNNPAIVQHQNNRVIVGFPDGLGLVLYDMTTPPDTPPLELSPWTAGLTTVQATWLPDAIGVLYFTTGSDHAVTAHYVQAEQSRGVWRVGWFGDEDPDWWFNTRNAVVTVSPDLQNLKVTGEADHTSPAFDELATSPHRTFSVEWHKLPSGYAMSPAAGSEAGRTAWLWQIAVPSAYATLVEFVERIRINDMNGAGRLVTDPSVVATAFSFGLQFPENRFQITDFDPNRITIISVRGTFVVSIKPPPQGADRPWLISAITPIGIAPPTP